MVGVALIGLLLGAGLHHVIPRKYAATTNVYLSEPTASDPAQSMANDVSLLQTRAVAEPAVTALHLRVTTESFLSSYQGLALSNAILAITVSAHSPTDAVSRADAVARSFLAVRSNLVRLQTQVQVSGLKSQVGSLDSQITNLSSSIDVLSSNPTASTSGTELANLVNERSQDSSQVAQLASEIQQVQLNETSVNQGSQVLDRAALVKVSAAKVTIIDALSGLIGALGLALIALVMAVLVSDRLRSRGQVASALGAPIDLSLLRVASRRAMRPKHQAQLLLHPTSALQMMERRLRDALESGAGSSLAVVELEAAEPSALAVSMLAFSLASEGLRVVMVDMAQGRPLATLLGVTGSEKRLHTVTLENRSAVLMIGPDDPAEMGREWNPKGADAVLVLSSIDPTFGSEQLAALGGASSGDRRPEKGERRTHHRDGRVVAPRRGGDQVRHPHRRPTRGRRRRRRGGRPSVERRRPALPRRAPVNAAVTSLSLAFGGPRGLPRTRSSAGCGSCGRSCSSTSSLTPSWRRSCPFPTRSGRSSPKGHWPPPWSWR